MTGWIKRPALTDITRKAAKAAKAEKAAKAVEAEKAVNEAKAKAEDEETVTMNGGRGNGNAKFDGNCHNCGKHGHKAVDCWIAGRPNSTRKAATERMARAEMATSPSTTFEAPTHSLPQIHAALWI